jgi:hypothetical protein
MTEFEVVNVVVVCRFSCSDCKVSTHPNLGRGIMVTFKMVSSIARVDATICICFVDGTVADRMVVLDCLEE